MTLKPTEVLVLDQDALNAVSAAVTDANWFEAGFPWPDGASGIRRVVRGRVVYLLSSKADLDSRLLIISGGDDGPLNAPDPQYVFDRIVHVALSTFENNVAVPLSWKSYNLDSLFSIYAYPHSLQSANRVYFDRNPDGQDHVFAYGITDSKNFDDVQPNLADVRSAIGGLIEALIAEAPSAGSDGGSFGIVLARPDGNTIVGAATLEEWYAKKLTAQQRAFVDKGYAEPVRLKGAAGTGKTLSMAVKCLRDLLAAEDAGEAKKFAFLTHSASIAHDTLKSIFDALDPMGRWRRPKHASLWIGSLYEYAQTLLRYDEKGLEPLSVDGREGRLFQALLVSDALSELRANTRFKLSVLGKCSDKFQSLFATADESSRFTYELMNEIACVIDAENIRLGNAHSAKYLSGNREQWQMPLLNEFDRRAVLDVHDVYRRFLEKSGVLSMDQMVADLNRYLDSHEWSRLCDTSGFDAIFVDELHFFNRAERMIFHGLFRSSAKADGKMPLFMSYDLKQSPADSFLGGGSSESAATFFQRLKAGESQLVELTEVFRSTPEIAAFLSDLDAAFPALDLENEWGLYSGKSDQTTGPKPIVREYQNSVDLLDDVFSRACKDAQELGGRHVAVLCMNEGLYNRYLNVGRIEGKYVELSGRDQVGELKYAGKRRCVFSMPEYVAGLQFKVVYLIHVDRAEIDLEDGGIGPRRRFVSKCYLGASRAAEKLEIASSKDRGGKADIVDRPIDRGSAVLG